MSEERIKEIFSDEEFVKELFGKETPEEAQALLAEKDIDLSVEELVKLKDIIAKKLRAAEDGKSTELTEADLENVAGGSGPAIAAIAFIAVSAIILLKIKVTMSRW